MAVSRRRAYTNISDAIARFSCVEDWVAGSLGKQKTGWNVNSNRLRSEIMLGRLRLRALEE